jgi:hypothetical protein
MRARGHLADIQAVKVAALGLNAAGTGTARPRAELPAAAGAFNATPRSRAVLSADDRIP